MLEEDLSNADSAVATPNETPAAPADDLPRPPRGRRSATRPVGPPPAAKENESVAAVADAPAADQPAADQPAGEAAPAKAPARSRSRRSTTRTSKPEASQAPAEAEAAADPEAQPAEPVAAEKQPAAATTRKPATSRTSTRRSSSRAKAQPAADAETPATSPELEAALEAVEATAPKRSRRASRATAASLVEGDVPTKSDGEVDTQQVLASLAAAIAGRADSVAELEPGAKAAALEAPVAKPELEPGAPEAEDEAETEEEGEQVAAETDEDTDEEQAAEDGDESAESEQQPTSSQRRRRRRGGRRRRRGSASETSDDDSADDDSTDDGADSETDAGSDEGQSDGDADDSTDAGGSSSNRRRRRRRRRGGDDSGSDDDQGDVVVRVREPRRSVNDEISGIEGSTRLEAKKQRRREGRAAGRQRAPILTEAEFLARRESVDRVMLVRQRDDYTQLAVLEDGVLVEHYVDRSSSTSLIGNVYLGRVQNVLPSMEAVFIDIGRGRNAVLYAGEVDWNAFDVSADSRKVEQVFKSGQAVLVQVSKDPVGAKGARLTGHISLPGRYVVYSPGGHLSGISRKLPDAERQRLKSILDTVVAEESSVIVRTAAEGASSEELVADVERLKAQWQQIEKKAKQGSAPQQLYTEPDLTLRVVRDTFTEDFKRLVVAGNGGPNDAYQAVSSYVEHVAPNLAERLEKWDDAEGDPFAKFRIDEQISKALERKVFLPSGGSLVIDRTEAMTVIDVNTGKFTGSGGNLEETVTRNNLEAAEEIVRQLRLRDLGGIIVIDFIDMVLPSNRELLLRRLVECLGRDRTRHQVSEVTSLGLVQMTRKRIGTGLAEAFTDVCEHCGGRGYVRHDEPVETQAPADGGERRGRSSNNSAANQAPASTTNSSGRSRTRSSSRSRAKAEEAPKANQVQPSEAAKQAAARLAAAARNHPTTTPEEQSYSSGEVVIDVAPTEEAPIMIVEAEPTPEGRDDEEPASDARFDPLGAGDLT